MSHAKEMNLNADREELLKMGVRVFKPSTLNECATRSRFGTVTTKGKQALQCLLVAMGSTMVKVADEFAVQRDSPDKTMHGIKLTDVSRAADHLGLYLPLETKGGQSAHSQQYHKQEKKHKRDKDAAAPSSSKKRRSAKESPAPSSKKQSKKSPSKKKREAEENDGEQPMDMD